MGNTVVVTRAFLRDLADHLIGKQPRPEPHIVHDWKPEAIKMPVSGHTFYYSTRTVDLLTWNAAYIYGYRMLRYKPPAVI